MKKIRLGVMGIGRGVDLASAVMLAGAEIVAVCDFHKKRVERARHKFDKGVAFYEDFDKFIEHPMDGVIVANFFNEHAPYAIKCLERGIHVLSECISNGTMAEGVALIRAASKSKAIYMLAENYPFMKFNREMKRVRESGALGKVLYAEGEYNHPVDPMEIPFKKYFVYCPEHWRNYLPATYYITHSLGPVMSSTGATPVRVTANAIYCPSEGAIPSASMRGDRAAIIMTQNDDGSVFRVTGCSAFGGHENSYRVAGTRGQIENLRGMGNKVMLMINDWELKEGEESVKCYEPEWNDKDEDLIKQTGHGGADYLTMRTFVECIREGKQPDFPFDVHSAVTMSSVAILANRSMLEGGKPYDIPDFHKEEDLLAYENDYLTPFIGPNGEAPTVPCCSHPDYKYTDEQMQIYRKLILEEE